MLKYRLLDIWHILKVTGSDSEWSTQWLLDVGFDDKGDQVIKSVREDINDGARSSLRTDQSASSIARILE